MPSTPFAFPSCVAVCVTAAAVSAPAAGAVGPISGKLSQPRYTVIALAGNGNARTVFAAGGNFSLVPPAATSTLHLRAPDGTYAGPVVLGEKPVNVAGARTEVRRAKSKLRRVKRNLRETREEGQHVRRAKRRVRKAKRRLARAELGLEQAQLKQAQRPNRAILGVRDGTALGDVEIRSAGYAKTARLEEAQLDATQLARARNGVPVGAGVFGRVVSPHLPGRVPGDADVDGVPDALDIDDDGDLLLDNFEERSAGARAAQFGPGGPVGLSSGLEQVRINQTMNANAAALTVADIDEVLKTIGRLQLGILPGDASPNSPELDCRGLIYCSLGGTGRRGFAGSPPPPFPECCDPDADGAGTMLSWNGTTPDFFIAPHGATTAQVGTGDVLIERVLRDGVEIPFAATLQFVFATVPAVVSYSDTAGNCAQVAGTAGTCATTFSYPVAPPGSDCSKPGCPGGLGTEGNGFPVASGPSGDMEVTLTFWRPQRTPVPPETAQWIDIGGLTHIAAFGCDENGCGNKNCPPAAYSTPAGSELTLRTLPIQGAGLADSAPDREANPQNTFTYTVNLSECLRDPRGPAANAPLTWNSGQERQLVFQATTLLDRAEQIIYFKRQ